MIDTETLECKFSRIGARLRHAETPGRRGRVAMDSPISLDVQHDRRGEFFQVIGRRDVDAEAVVLDIQPAERHLLLLVRGLTDHFKFLCGHDERHWFVAAVPESAPVGTVRQAREALKPEEVRDAQARARLGAAAGNRRKNAAYRRQGEWFFVPAPELLVDQRLVLEREPITRGNGGKPHVCEFCYRSGGEMVYVCRRYPNGIDSEQYCRLLEERPRAGRWGWRAMYRNAHVYARGRVRHPDHRTITLHGWHRVLMNTEAQARAMRSLVFLD